MANGSAPPSVLGVDRSAAVATLVINRPERGNSLTTELKVALRDTLQHVAADPQIRAVVLTGTGRFFCTGQDLGEHAAGLQADADSASNTVAEHYNPIVTALATMPKPVIAAVNGSCAGAGIGFALACDLRVLAAGARFTTAFAGIGFGCDSGLSATLARAVGVPRAAELLLLGEPFTAEEAVSWGMSGTVVPAEQVRPTAEELAQRLAAGPTRAYAEIKAALAATWDLPGVLQREAAAQARLARTADHQRAVAAFLAREQPTFTGE